MLWWGRGAMPASLTLSTEGRSPAVALTCQTLLDLSLLQRAALPKALPLSLGSQNLSPTPTVPKGHPSLTAPLVVAYDLS